MIGAVLGAASVGLYSLPMQIIEYTRLAVSGYSGVLSARITVLHAKGDEAALRRAYLLALRVTSLIASFLLANVMWLGVPFLECVGGPEFRRACALGHHLAQPRDLPSCLQYLAALPFYTGMHILGLPAKVLVTGSHPESGVEHHDGEAVGDQRRRARHLIPACVSFALLPRWLSRTLSVSAHDLGSRGDHAGCLRWRSQ